MKFEKIEYGESINMITGERWVKNNVVISLDDTDDADVCHKRAVDKVNSWNQKIGQSEYSNPSLINGAVEEPQSVPMENMDKIQAFIATINYANTKKLLERFYPQVQRENNEKLTEAYNNKLKSFQ